MAKVPKSYALAAEYRHQAHQMEAELMRNIFKINMDRVLNGEEPIPYPERRPVRSSTSTDDGFIGGVMLGSLFF